MHFNHFFILWNESLKSECQQFHQYQQNKQSHISSIVIISQVWKSKILLLVEETRENHQPASSDCQTSSHNVVSSTPYYEWGLN